MFIGFTLHTKLEHDVPPESSWAQQQTNPTKTFTDVSQSQQLLTIRFDSKKKHKTGIYVYTPRNNTHLQQGVSNISHTKTKCYVALYTHMRPTGANLPPGINPHV